MSYAYEELPGLEHVYLEDSWVLGVTATYREVVFVVEFVLTEGHEFYGPARPGEQYCYRKGELRFSEITDLRWADQTSPPTIDASGEIDYDNIDSLNVETGRYVLRGGFGQIMVKTESLPTIHWP